MAIIQVSADASKEIMPDRTKLILTHKIHRYDYGELTYAAGAEKNVISSAVAHITDAKIIIESAYTAPVYNYGEKKHSRVNDGYEYVGRYTIDLDLEAKTLDDIILALTAIGLNLTITNNDYYSDGNKIRDLVIGIAMREATAKAKIIAKEINTEIASVEGVDYSSSHMPTLMRAMREDENFERKPIVINESVTMKFKTL